MGILQLILILVIIGVVMFVVNRYVPMDSNIRKIMNIAVAIFVVLWLLAVMFPGVLGMNDVRIGN